MNTGDAASDGEAAPAAPHGAAALAPHGAAAPAPDGAPAPSPDGAAPAPAVRDSRTAAAEVADHEAPPGCFFRRYQPPNKPGFWKGWLAPGKLSDEGRRSKQAGWGFYAGRSRDEAYSHVKDWLHEWS